MKEKLTVLGSGVCVSGMGFEEKDRWPPAYLVEGISPELLLFEVSEGVRFRINQSGYEYTHISDILISHLHPDHFDLVPFVQAVAIKKPWSNGKFGREKINIYGPKGTKEAFWQIWKYLVPEHPESIYGGLLTLDFFELRDGQSVDFYQNKLLAFEVFHAFGKCKSLAFRLETPSGVFAYSGDSARCSGLERAALNADTFLCDCSTDINEDKSTTSGHLNPFQAGELAKKVNAKQIWLTHYSGKDAPNEIIKDCRRSGFSGEILVIKDNDRMDLFLKWMSLLI